MGPLGKAGLFLFAAAVAWSQDPRELVRHSVGQNQLDWVRMKDYTWQAQSVERRFDSHGKVQSTQKESWDTVMLDGQPYRRDVSRDGKPLSDAEQRSEQKKIDRAVARLSSKSEGERKRAADEAEARRKREFAFLAEIPDVFDLKLEGEAAIDGRPVWVVSGTPRPDAHPKTSDAKVLLKVRGKLWIDKATYQWVKVEAETTDTISWGVFLARLHPGARLVFEQAEITPELWLPKRLYMTGSGRIGLVKRLAEDTEINWSNYRKFSVESKITTDLPR